MTAAEIVMKRDDPNIAWGFRLTGGADLGTPFYVVKVLGRGHAERAGLRVGDMVYAINHKYANNFTHKDAQNEILHTGDTLILNIKRGHGEGRGTPLPDYADPLMGIAVPPETPRPKPSPLPPYQPPIPIIQPSPPPSDDEEGEETVAAFNVKINPKGRIAEIEELPVTPPPSRSPSRARSRSRSASRDRRRSASAKRESAAVQKGFVPVQNGCQKTQPGFQGVQNGISGPGETFTYSKEVITQYSTVLSASSQDEGNVSETVNESFVIHGGSTHKMEDVLSPEDIERDIFEEKMEEQKLTELLTGEAEVLEQGVVGNPHRISMGIGVQHSVMTHNKASNTVKLNGSKNPVNPTAMESTHCDLAILGVEDYSNDVKISEVESMSRGHIVEVQDGHFHDVEVSEMEATSKGQRVEVKDGEFQDVEVSEVESMRRGQIVEVEDGHFHDIETTEVESKLSGSSNVEVQYAHSHGVEISEVDSRLRVIGNVRVQNDYVKILESQEILSNMQHFQDKNETRELNETDIKLISDEILQIKTDGQRTNITDKMKPEKLLQEEQFHENQIFEKQKFEIRKEIRVNELQNGENDAIATIQNNKFTDLEIPNKIIRIEEEPAVSMKSPASEEESNKILAKTSSSCIIL